MAATTSTEAVLASGSADTDLVFRKFLRLCEAAGPDRCALAGHGPVVTRVNRFLARLRRDPIPVPSGELTYGEALTAVKYSGLADPASWPQVAGVLELAVEGDASVLDTVATGATADEVRVLLQEQGVALVCADSPARHPAAWPGVVRRLAAVSRIGGPPVGWINAPCASWPTRSADRYTGPGTPPPGIRSWSSAPGSTPTRPWSTPGAPPGGWATRSS